MLTLLSRPDSGAWTVAGFDASHPSEIKRLIGVMPQENNLDRELTARENLLIYGMLHGLDGLERRIEANAGDRWGFSTGRTLSSPTFPGACRDGSSWAGRS